MRKLATIRRIADIQPIEGADAIEVAAVDGWKVVVKKGEFRIGDLAVYFEIDSVLPIMEEFEFLRKGCYVKKDWLVSETNPTGEGFRLKTIRLRGQVSQGLLVPVRESMLNTLPPTIGDDLTGTLRVVKWDPPLPATLSGKAKGNFPSFIPKTDQERIQNVSDLDKYANDEFEVTLKLDGSSMTVYSYEGKIGVCSRNLELDYINSPDTAFARVFLESGLAEAIPDGLAIQGELMGPGIQGNRENLKEHSLFVFDVYNILEGRYLKHGERVDLVNSLRKQGILISHCPIQNIILAARKSKEELLAMAEGPSLVHKVREGLVFKSIQNPEFSFKAISNKFLLKSSD
jgi:RNA ligase (TIGR02306 family)